MKPRFCYWTIGSGAYADLVGTLVASARAVGVTEDFHAWTDRQVPGVICHRAGRFDNWGWLFKLVFLRDEVARLDYDYFIYLDADTWFVRHPGDPARVMQDAPLHASLEADLARTPPGAVWWEYPAETFVRLMREAGMMKPAVYGLNAGMFMTRKAAIQTVYDLANAFWQHCRRQGVLWVDEPLLAYAMQMLCDDPEPHTLTATQDFWATDSNGVFRDRLPDGKPFRFQGFHGQHDCLLNPAIVHVPRAKQVLFDHARRIHVDSLSD